MIDGKRVLGGLIKLRGKSCFVFQSKSASIGGWKWGPHSSEEAFVFLTQQPQVRFSAFPKNFIWNFLMSLGFIDAAA